MYNEKVSPEEEEEIIEKTANIIHKYGLDLTAILALESTKPLSSVGGQMGRIFLTPFMPVLGDTFNELGNKLIIVFEKKENVEKLIKKLEYLEKKE